MDTDVRVLADDGQLFAKVEAVFQILDGGVPFAGSTPGTRGT